MQKLKPVEIADGTLLEHSIKAENGFNNNHSANNIDSNGNQHVDESNQSVLSSISNNSLSKATMLKGDFEFLRYLNIDELKMRMANLDLEMEAEIEELRRRYAAKRQPILDAMDSKKKRQQNF